MPSLFDTDVARNPILRDVSRSFNGKTVRQYTVDTDGNNVTGSLGPDGALRRMFDVLALRATPILISETRDTGSVFDVFFEGDFPTDDYGNGEETFADYLQAELRALSSVDGVTLTATTVTEAAGSPFFADDVEADYS